MIKEVYKKPQIRKSGRSSDYISPSFIYGCLYKCAYCYCQRYTDDISIGTNADQLLTCIDKHVASLGERKPNQTHDKYWTYDIGCNTDIPLMWKYYDWLKVFDFFKNHPRAFGTFATKRVNPQLLEYNPDRKLRIRFSLMPQQLSYLLEPNTSLIQDRINAIEDFYKAGYDVHVNFSPVIINSESKELYRELFHQLNSIPDYLKEHVKAEVIMLTHNEGKHLKNLEAGRIEEEELLWVPERQESKISSYGNENLRYKRELKYQYVQSFRQLHSEIIPWNTIRYIF